MLLTLSETLTLQNGPEDHKHMQNSRSTTLAGAVETLIL